MWNKIKLRWLSRFYSCSPMNNQVTSVRLLLDTNVIPYRNKKSSSHNKRLTHQTIGQCKTILVLKAVAMEEQKLISVSTNCNKVRRYLDSNPTDSDPAFRRESNNFGPRAPEERSARWTPLLVLWSKQSEPWSTTSTVKVSPNDGQLQDTEWRCWTWAFDSTSACCIPLHLLQTEAEDTRALYRQ